MRHKISKFSLIIFLFSSNFKLFGYPCDECLYCCCGVLSEDYKEKIKEDYKSYIENEINNSKILATSDKNIGEKEKIKNYNFQTNVLHDFVEHYKNSKEVLPNYFFYVLDILLEIPISNKDLINIMKKKLDWETKKEQLKYIDINRIVEVENIEEMADKNKRYILKKEDGELITKDLPRTWYDIEGFNKQENLAIFKKIIYNFISQLYKSGINTGYCQGMNFYAGFFLILCKDEDPSGKLAFELLYLFMTKEWGVNDYITGTTIINEGTYEKPNNKEKKYVEEKYNIISFYMNDFLITRLINNKICDNMTFLKEEDKEHLKGKAIFISLFFGLKNLNIDMIRKIFFLILLVKNCKIFFDIVNFVVNVSPQPNNKEEDEFAACYNNDLFHEFVKRYTE